MRFIKAIWALILSTLVKWAFKLKAVLSSRLIQWKGRLMIQSLRTAIHDADKDKEATGRKNMVVYNTDSGQYEPVQKKLLKSAAKAKIQPPVKRGWRIPKAVKQTTITKSKVKEVEKESLYVTN